MRVLEVAIFLGLSAAVHAAVFVAAPEVGGERRGSDGTGQVSLAAANAATQQMVEDWSRPPETQSAPRQIARPQPESAPNLPRMEGITEHEAPATAIPAPAPAPQDRPQIDAVPMVQTSPSLEVPRDTSYLPDTAQINPRPPRPTQRPANPTPSEAPSVAQVARGSGGGESQGAAPQPAQTSGLSAGERNTLLSQWGAAIIARIERNRPNVSDSGAVSLRIMVARNGTLEGLAVIGSSGNPDLDQAALRAVERARRFPAAPSGLTEGNYRFDLPIRFQ